MRLAFRNFSFSSKLEQLEPSLSRTFKPASAKTSLNYCELTKGVGLHHFSYLGIQLGQQLRVQRSTSAISGRFKHQQPSFHVVIPN